MLPVIPKNLTFPDGHGSVTKLVPSLTRGATSEAEPNDRSVAPRVSKGTKSIAIYVLALALLASMPLCAEKPSFTVGWSVYVGWNPYYYMAKSGILAKWADKYGINIRVQRFDYAPSLDAFVAKNIDACAMTNMEALDMPAAAGVDTTAIIVGDYSNGNDAVIVRQNLSLAQIPGKQVMLVEKTVSQYLFERAMAINGLGAADTASALSEHFRFRYRVCVS